MTGWIIFLSVLGLLLLIILVPVRVHISWKTGGDLRASVHILCFFKRFSLEKLLSRETKEVAKDVKEEEKEQEQEEGGLLKKAKAWRNTIEIIWGILKASRRPLAYLGRRTVFYRVRADVQAGGEDAHVVAIRYGQVMAAASVALDLIQRLFSLRRPRIRITPDFTGGQWRADLHLCIRLQPVFLLIAAGSAGINWLAQTRSEKKRQKIQTANPIAQ